MSKKPVSGWLFVPIVAMFIISVGFGFSDAQKKAGVTEPELIDFRDDVQESQGMDEVLSFAEKKIVTIEVVKAGREEAINDGEYETTVAEAESVAEPEVESPEAEVTEPEAETVPESSEEAVTEPPTTTAEQYPVYICDGYVMEEDLQRFLYKTLKEHGIEWWMPYAIAQATQESECDPNDITDGLDYGLFQYRILHWADKATRYGYTNADIMNPYIQIDIYVHEMARRLKDFGLDKYEAMSRHFTSDYGEYNQKYVDDVMERFVTLERIK